MIKWLKSWFEWVTCKNCDKVIWAKIATRLKVKVADQKDYCGFDLCRECTKTWEEMAHAVFTQQVYKQNQLLEEARNARKQERARSLEVHKRNQSDEPGLDED